MSTIFLSPDFDYQNFAIKLLYENKEIGVLNRENENSNWKVVIHGMITFQVESLEDALKKVSSFVIR